MKPTFQFNEIKVRRSDTAVTPGAALPKMDFHYQSSLQDFGGRCRPGDGPSFRSISTQYFKDDARRIFAVETALFGLIVMIVAVPVVQSATGLAQLLQGLWIS